MKRLAWGLLFALVASPAEAEELARVPAAGGRPVVVERDPNTGTVTITIPTAHGKVLIVVDGSIDQGDDAPTVPTPQGPGSEVARILDAIEGIARLDVARSLIAAGKDTAALAGAGRLKPTEVPVYWQSETERRLGIRYREFGPVIRAVCLLGLLPESATPADVTGHLADLIRGLEEIAP